MGFQGAQANDQDQLQAAQLRPNDVPLQATADVHQERRDAKPFGEVHQLDSGLYFHVQECRAID